MSKPISPKQAATLCRLFQVTEAQVRQHLPTHDKASPIIGAAKSGNATALINQCAALGLPSAWMDNLEAKLAAYRNGQPAPETPAQEEAPAPTPEEAQPETPAPAPSQEEGFRSIIMEHLERIDGVAEILADKARVRIASALDQIIATADQMLAEAAKAAVPAPGQGVVPLPPATPGYIRPAWYANLAAAGRARLNVVLSGPAGTGKSRAARELASDLGLPCQVIDCRAGMTRADFFYSRAITEGETRWELAQMLVGVQEPGVTCLNEPFSLDPEVLLGFNALLEEREMLTPLGVIKVHEDHVFILAANIAGRSESRIYRGAQAQDASVLSRCVNIRTAYESAVEQGIASAMLPKGDAKALVQAVEQTRAALERAQVAHDVTPRVYRQVAGLVSQGLTLAEAARLVILGPLEPSEVGKVASSVSLFN